MMYSTRKLESMEQSSEPIGQCPQHHLLSDAHQITVEADQREGESIPGQSQLAYVVPAQCHHEFYRPQSDSGVLRSVRDLVQGRGDAAKSATQLALVGYSACAAFNMDPPESAKEQSGG